jgi:DNA repair protein RadA/Sms
VAQSAARLKEAQKLGFARAVLPESARGEGPDAPSGLALNSVGALVHLVSEIAANGDKPCEIEPDREA